MTTHFARKTGQLFFFHWLWTEENENVFSKVSEVCLFASVGCFFYCSPAGLQFPSNPQSNQTSHYRLDIHKHLRIVRITGSDINFLVKAPGGDLKAFFQSPDAKIWSPKGVHKKVLLQIIDRNMKLLNSFVGSASNTRIPYSWTIGKASKTCTETFQCVSFEDKCLSWKTEHNTSFVRWVLVSM